MFTGIIQSLCRVAEIINKENALTLSINFGPKGAKVSDNIELGSSIAVNGTCLTVVGLTEKEDSNNVYFDVIEETLKRTNLGLLRTNDFVNVERSLKVGQELGGHQVSGHVDCTARVIEITKSKNNCEMFFELTEDSIEEYIFSKGFIAVDGISLTIVKKKNKIFSVCLIPETLSRTTLGIVKVNDYVNIEVDYHSKVIVETLKKILPSVLGNCIRDSQQFL